MSAAFRRYAELLDRLFWRRATGLITDDEEEQFAEALNDCRPGMEPGEEAEIAQLIAEKRNLQHRQELPFHDTTPERFSTAAPRQEGALG